MINFFRSWCEGIIVAVIISIIIESILPEGNHRKYVKVVIGIYIIFTILNPFLGKLNTDIDLDYNLNLNTVETSSINAENIRQLYASGIEETLKKNVEEEFGYIVNDVIINYDKNYENIESMNISIKTNYVSKIEKVQIGNKTEETQANNDYSDVKNYISENYDLDKSKIFVN